MAPIKGNFMTKHTDSLPIRERFPSILLVCFLFGLSCVLLPSPAFADRPPNIIVILADDLGCRDLKPYGGWVETPRIERMAREGLTFTDFHSNSSVCSPTRAAFLTGRYQQRVGIVDVIVGNREPDQGIPPSTPTLARVFQEERLRDRPVRQVALRLPGQVQPRPPRLRRVRRLPQRRGGLPPARDLAQRARRSRT